MITREEYLKALTIVEGYHKGFSAGHRIQKDLKVGDKIEFSRVNPLSKYVQTDEYYKVIHVSNDIGKWYGTFTILLKNKKTKIMKRITQGYHWRIVGCE